MRLAYEEDQRCVLRRELPGDSEKSRAGRSVGALFLVSREWNAPAAEFLFEVRFAARGEERS